MDQDIQYEASYKVAPNIALIKYWGKYDSELILPLNSSVSITLSAHDLFSQTTVVFTNSSKVQSDCLILNKKEDIITNRINKILNYFREHTKELLHGTNKIDQNTIKQMHFLIDSTNNFPTAAGLASSASGLACLVCCLKQIFNFQEEYPQQLTEIARWGSGSACRSLHGGIVEWTGVSQDILSAETKPSQSQLEELSKQCIAKQIFHQDEIAKYTILVIIGDSNEKKTKSTFGMQQTVETSQLLQVNLKQLFIRKQYRVKELVPLKLKKLKEAIKQKNINETAKIIMEDSNQFHATCLDTMPPLFYLNQLSTSIISCIHNFNKNAKLHVAYTFDAGPNAVLLIPQDIYSEFINSFWNAFKIKENFEKIEFFPKEEFQKINNIYNKEEEIENFGEIPKIIIKTSIGDGPIQM